MKRAEPHYPTNEDNDSPCPSNLNLNPMNLISVPVKCPFCTKTDFGVVYNPPTWLPQDRRLESPPREIATSPLSSSSDLPLGRKEEMYPPGHEQVVLIDNIRPDWYQALAHRRRVEARRLATATALQQALAVAGQRRRSTSRLPTPGMAGAVGAASLAQERRVGRRVDGMIRITRDEADEMMLQEAIRQSLMTEEEERRKREEEERKKRGESENAGGQSSASSTPVATPSPSSAHPQVVAPRLSTSSPASTSILPRIHTSSSTSPPSPRSFFSALRSRSGSHSSRNGSSPPNLGPTIPSPRPQSMHILSPPTNDPVRRQPSLPDMTTSASLSTAMHDSTIPGLEDTRPSISSPLAQNVTVPTVQVESSPEDDDQHDEPESSPPATSVSTNSSIDEIVPIPVVIPAIAQDRNPLKTRGDGGSVEEHEVVELSS